MLLIFVKKRLKREKDLELISQKLIKDITKLEKEKITYLGKLLNLNLLKAFLFDFLYKFDFI